uniref:Thioredoxin like 4A n=1 Tax=Canis lupus dingo TaxID=286419 RepID=A0A8C0JZG4_CANLU
MSFAHFMIGFWSVDQAILSEEDLMVVICFGHDWDPMCMKMDEVLYSMAENEQAHHD